MKFKKVKKFVINFVKKTLNFSIGTRILLFIFFLGLFLRFLGTNPGYPLNHPDEPTIKDSARIIALYLDFKPIGFFYGQLLPIIYAIGFVIFFIPGLFIIFSITNFSEILDRGLMGYLHYFRFGQLGYDSDPHQYFYYWSRYESAILSSLTILMVYFLGKRLFSKQVGLIAAFLTAVNYRHVLSSSFALADAPAALFALLSVFLSTNLLKSQSFKTYLMAGTGVALALSVKYFVYIIPAFLFCFLLGIWSLRQSILEKLKQTFINKKFFAAVLWAILLFFIINPYLILDYKRAYWELFVYNVGRYGGGFTHINPAGAIFPLYYLWGYYLSGIGSVAVLVGSIYALFRYKMKSLIILSVIASFMYVFLLVAGGTYMRNYAAIMPFLLFFPAILIRDIALLVGRGNKSVWIMAVLTVLLGITGLRDSFLSSYYLSRPHNQIELNKWLESSMPKGSSILNMGVALPTNMEFKDIPGLYSGTHSFVSMEEMRESDAEFIIISSYSPVISNFELWKANNLAWGNFFDQKELFNFVDNTYVSLVMSEIGDYRIKEFAHPSLFSLDRAFLVARFPEVWKPRTDTEVVSFVFDDPRKYADWKMPGKEKSDSQKARSLFGASGVSSGIIIRDRDCVKPSTQISSPLFDINQGEWYTLIGEAIREYEPARNQYSYTTGFFRLDFFGKDGDRLKTYVSKALRGIEGVQQLAAVGFAPERAEYAKVAFQLDTCLTAERYIIKDIKVYSANVDPVDKKQYPFYGKPLLKSFIWKYEL